ncbi:MAG: cell division protein FtsZ [Arcobacteraceae bacterium]|nr:cell division protein FtsZ [Arcobacteraceae bacterium]
MTHQQDTLFDPINIEILRNPDLGNNMAKLTLMGVGGGGCNMIDNYVIKNQYLIKIIASNTDNQVLQKSTAPVKIQLGPKTTNGLGAGMNPDVGRKAALESAEEIHNQLNGSDMVFLCAGLGGGTGSGALPVVIQIAKELGILCVVVVTMPFSYEIGRDSIAQNALEQIKCHADAYIVIYNDNILKIVPETTGVMESFQIIDNVFFDAVHGLCDIILNYHRLNINVDFADISTTLTKKGLALIGIGQAKGDDSAKKALSQAIKSPLLGINSINNCKSIIIHFTFNPKFPIHKMNEIMHYVKNNADLGAKCIVGTVYNDQMEDNEVKVTLIATGFDIADKENQQKQKELSLENIEKKNLEKHQQDTPKSKSIFKRLIDNMF